MAKGSVNKVILVGNLGRDPEVRYTPNGLAVANITIATTEQWKDKQSSENQERTEWHRVVFYSRLARYTTEIIADSMQMLDSKGSGGGNNNQGEAPAHTSEKPGADMGQPQAATDNFDDDIPF